MNEFKKFFENSVDNSPLSENEYEKDGLKYCKKCNKPVQCLIKTMGNDYIVRCTCDCDTYDDDYEQLKERERIAQLKNDIPIKYLKMTFENSDAEIGYAKKYVENFDKYKAENIGLMLLGDKGTGKTYSAACIANALTDKGVSVYMDNILNIANMMGDFTNTDYISDKIKYSQLLIIDDIGAERQTDYMCEKIYSIINMRYMSGKPLIITSNLTTDQLKKCDDIRLVRTYDRLKEMCHPITITGESRRIKKANERYQRLKEELG